MSAARTRLFVLSSVALLACGGARASSPEAAAAPAGQASIAWESFGDAAFERAATENRMVLLDVGIEGCTACRWMFEDTYRDADVVGRINAHFVPVAIDADLRPDLGERYERWGWPATIVLTADGTQVLALRGNKRPRTFVPILDALIERHAAGTLERDADVPIDAATPDGGELARLCSAAVGRVAASASESGGFGGRMKPALGAPVRWELARAAATGDERWAAHVERTLAGYARMIDPEWGGIFVVATADFSRTIPEKRTIHQGPVLAAFAEAYHASGDASYLEAARGIDRYLQGWMRAPDGTYYATQEDAAPGLPSGMDASAYYALPDAQRRVYGLPPIDHGVYTDLNAVVIEAHARLYQATGEAADLAKAVAAGERMLARQHADGWLLQSEASEAVAADARMRPIEREARIFLEPQGPIGLAFLELYSVTAEPRWLAAAQGIARGLAALEDAERGGFFASDATDTDRLGRRRPYDENVSTARFLVRLGWATRDASHAARAERTLRAVGPGARVGSLRSTASDLARVLEELAWGPVEMTVVGSLEDPAARALHLAGVRSYAPRGVVHYEAAGVRYPDTGSAAMFVCTLEACSSPVHEPAEVAAVVARMSLVGDRSACPRP